MKFFYVVLKDALMQYVRLYSGWTAAEQQPRGRWPVLDHEFGPSIGVAFLDHEFGPSVGVGLFSELQNALFGGPKFTFSILDRQNLDHLLEML